MVFLALRQLLSRPRQTLLALLGISLGTAAFLTISGLMLGFRQLFIDQLINSSAHVSVSAREDAAEAVSLGSFFFPDSLVHWVSPPSSREEDPHLEYAQGWYERLEKDPDVLAYAPQLTAQVLLARAKLSRPVHLLGVDPARQVKATDVERNMIEGKFSDLSRGSFQAILGSGLAEKLGARCQDTVQVVDAKGRSFPVKVAGIFRSGITEIDDSTAYAPLYHAQQVARRPGRVSQVIVRLKDPSLAREKAAAWGAQSREKVQSWDQANANFMAVFKMQDMIRFILCLVILTVAAFGIYNILNMMVLQKRGEIAILRSMGYGRWDIIRLFFLQGLALGVVGGLGGLALGTLFCLYLQTIEVGAAGIVQVNHLLIGWKAQTYLFGFLLAFVSGVVAGFFPARAASRMSPIDILRAEG